MAKIPAKKSSRLSPMNLAVGPRLVTLGAVLFVATRIITVAAARHPRKLGKRRTLAGPAGFDRGRWRVDVSEIETVLTPDLTVTAGDFPGLLYSRARSVTL